jgi:hypothetical protein
MPGTGAIDTMRTCYRVCLGDQNNQFNWESMVALSAVQKENIDVGIKNT